MKPATAIITLVAIYGTYRFVTSSRRREIRAAPTGPALNPQRQGPAPAPALPRAQQPQSGQIRPPVQAIVEEAPNWEEVVTDDAVDRAAEEALVHEGLNIHSSSDLAASVARHLFPHHSWLLIAAPWQHETLAAIRSRIRQWIHWEDVPDTPEIHEAAVLLAAKGPAALQGALSDSDSREAEAFRYKIAASVFPRQPWPPPEGAPNWMNIAWARMGEMVEAALEEFDAPEEPEEEPEEPEKPDEPEEPEEEPEESQAPTDEASEPEAKASDGN